MPARIVTRHVGEERNRLSCVRVPIYSDENRTGRIH